MSEITFPYRKRVEFNIGTISTSYIKMINIFWISILLFSICYVMSSSLYSMAAIFQGIQIISILAFFFSLVHLIKLKDTNRYFLFFVGLLSIWQVLLLIRGDYAFMDYEDTKSMFFDANYGIFCLFVPLISLIKPNLIHLKKFMKVLVISSFIYLGYTLFFLPQMIQGDMLDTFSRELVESSFKFLAFPTMFFLLTSPYQSNRNKALSLIIFVLFMTLGAIKARRGILLMGGFVLGISIILNLWRTSNKIPWILVGVYLLVFVYQLVLIEFSATDIPLFSSLFDKGLVNTRTYVENCFFNSMSTMDWVIGKGYNAGYFCPGIDESIFKHGVRRVIETDYLQFILTGGILNLAMILFLMIPAAVLGMFYSKNLFCKSAACWILIWLVFLYPSNGFTFSVFHVSIWLMVSICYNGSFRNLDDKVLKKYLNMELKFNHREKA
ncbi:hypothetical protein [Algoriphagus halophilus]|uniref:O-Antigen ligase n=1 Tax=Algoriphagus halophilus TaxID=226505 RepID=A0A1N6EBN0_9BACT|nr:hypothetical protein [Algoriphagus halophilus]SIN80442.1 hypothetical protein SAMN05444394_1946 [Algoriphagus halophilus]